MSQFEAQYTTDKKLIIPNGFELLAKHTTIIEGDFFLGGGGRKWFSVGKDDIGLQFEFLDLIRRTNTELWQ